MPTGTDSDKTRALRAAGCLHPHPVRVVDASAPAEPVRLGGGSERSLRIDGTPAEHSACAR